MDERVVQFRVGVMVLAALLITGILASLFGDLRLSGYRIYIRFSEAPGVTRDTPIRKNGIRIGKVADVRFGPNDQGVVVTADIDSNRKVYHDEDCCINSSLIGLGSDTVLDFVRSTRKDRKRTPILAGETIDGVRSKSATQAIGDLRTELNGTMIEVKRASGKLGDTLERIDSLLNTNEDRINSIVAKTDSTLTSLRTALDNANEVMADKDVARRIKDALKKFPSVLSNVGETAKEMGGRMAEAKKQLHKLNGFTDYLEQNGGRIAKTFGSATEDLDLILRNLNQFSQKINNPNGSLAQLAADPELYQHVIRTVRNIDDLTRQLRPILDDARVFTDKIARHPEVLGVRGASERHPGIK